MLYVFITDAAVHVCFPQLLMLQYNSVFHHTLADVAVTIIIIDEN